MPGLLRSSRVHVCAFVAIAVLLLAGGLVSSAFGQTETGQISGTVLDQQGAAVPKARISIRNLGTSAVRETTSDDHGAFTATNLLPARYAVLVEAEGFTKLDQQVDLAPGGRVSLDLKLQIGKVSETIEVSASSVAVNTETQTLSTEIDSSKLESLPLLTRNPYDLIGTAGNVSSTADAGLTTRGGGYQINGLRAASNNILLDGASNNDEFGAGVGQKVPLDALQEFSVLTNNFTAEYGRAAGGVINVVTKSGSNALHGTAYEFNRVSRLAANTFDNNANGLKKPVFARNQFGYSVGGPVIKDKLFFFQSTELLRVRSAGPTLVFIPDAALLAASNANTQAFFNGATVRSGAQNLGTFSRNQLIAQGFDPCSGRTSGPCSSYNPDAPFFDKLSYDVPTDQGAESPQNDYEVVGRIDWNVSSKTQLYGRYAFEKTNFPIGSNVNSVYDGFDGGASNFNNNFLLSLTHNFSSSLVTQSKIVFNRLNNSQPLGKAPVGPTLYMFGNTPATVLGDFLNFPGYTPFSPGNAIPFGGPQNYVQTYHDISYTKGKHAFRFGGNYDYIRDNRTFGAYEEAVETLSTSSFGAGMDRFFNGVLRQFQVAVDPQGKLPCDDFRNPATVNPQCSITLPAAAPPFSRSNRYHEFGTYFQDSWRASRRLTLNLGVRWDYFGVQHNKNPNLDSNYYDANAGDIFHSIRGGNISVARLSDVGGLWAKDWNNFAPRLGFAWDVFGNGKTSLRGGYGIGYERNFGNVTFNVIQNPPGYLVVSLTAPVDIASLPITTNNFGPLGASSGAQGLPKASMRNVSPHIRTAYAHFYSLSVEREVARNVIVGVDYSGSKGEKLYSLENPNRVGSGNVYLGDPCPTTPCVNPATFAGTGSLTRLRNTQVTNINRRGGNGLSLYNGLNARVDLKNVANTGLTLRTNYTYAHAMDNLSSTFSESANNGNLGLLDPFNPKLDRGSADFDVHNRLAVSGTWDVPFARNTSGFAKRAFDGWTLSSIFTAHSGLPFTMYDCTGAFAVCPRAMVTGTRPSKTGVGNVASGAPNTFNYVDLTAINFDTTYFNPIVGISDFGPYPSTMLPRNYFRGPGAYNVDLGVYKTTKITERINLQFRAESFDLLNHSNLYIVQSDNDISSVSVVRAKRGVPPIAANERRNIQLALRLIF
jgi:outer membrane receptor protein involved in Fe transport